MNTFNEHLVLATARGYAKQLDADTKLGQCFLVLENMFAAIDAVVIEPQRPDAYQIALDEVQKNLTARGLTKFW